MKCKLCHLELIARTGFFKGTSYCDEGHYLYSKDMEVLSIAKYQIRIKNNSTEIFETGPLKSIIKLDFVLQVDHSWNEEKITKLISLI